MRATALMNMLNHSKFLGDGTKGLDFGEPTNKLAKCLEDLGKNEQDVADETPPLLRAPDLKVNHAYSPWNSLTGKFASGN